MACLFELSLADIINYTILGDVWVLSDLSWLQIRMFNPCSPLFGRYFMNFMSFRGIPFPLLPEKFRKKLCAWKSCQPALLLELNWGHKVCSKEKKKLQLKKKKQDLKMNNYFSKKNEKTQTFLNLKSEWFPRKNNTFWD